MMDFGNGLIVDETRIDGIVLQGKSIKIYYDSFIHELWPIYIPFRNRREAANVFYQVKESFPALLHFQKKGKE